MKIAVIHYNPIEYYPPVHNFINYFDKRFLLKVHTTFPKKEINLYKYDKTKIRRFSKHSSSNKLFRFINLLKFNFLSLFNLIKFRPKVVLYYETWSCVPVFLYKIFFRKTILLVHYHEFTPVSEFVNSSSSSLKILHKIEKKLLKKISWISHANDSRLSKFVSEFEIPKTVRLEIIPNFPPQTWIYKKQIEFSNPIKMVYVGSLSMKHMYLKEVVDWIIEQNGKFTLDIYSINIYEDALEYIKRSSHDLVHFKGGVAYDDLKNILTKYNIGLILYHGVSENVIYCAPNKLFEYYACGLDVWFSKDLITSRLYKREDCIPKILEVDFERLNDLNLNQLLNREKTDYKVSEFNAENVLIKFEKYLKELENTHP